ncbi:MAG: D-alanyl-D-alanine carboxypeptidase family protein [Faecalibacterium sp.]
MERRILAWVCGAAVCFWLFALAFGSAQGRGLRGILRADSPAASAVQTAAPADAQAVPAEQPALDLSCRAAILVDQSSGTVLYEQSADEQMPIASITKVMTLLLTFEAIHAGKLSTDTLVPISEHAYHMGGSQIWLEPGEQFNLDEMLRAICVSSANDAAVAVAELVGGSEPVFVEQMNARAAQLGMENTTFHNACGLDTEGHLSTARDVAIMSCYILNTCPEVLHYTGIWTDSLRDGQTQLVNTNKLLKRYNGITGLKTGTTGGAGVCISASAERDGLKLVAVVLGSPSSAERFDAATTLLDYGFANYQAAPVPALEERPLQLAVKGSAEDSVPLDYSALPSSLLLKKSESGALTAQITLPEKLSAPVRQGEQVGEVALFSGETALGSWPVSAAADAPELDFGGALKLLWQSLTGV